MRDRKSFILEILFPIILTFIACLVSFIELLENNKTTSIELYNFNNDSQIVYYTSSNIDYSEYQSIFKDDKNLKNYSFKFFPNIASREENSLLTNLLGFLNVIYENNKKEEINNNYANFYLIIADKIKHYYEFATYISTRQRHSPIAFSNYLLKNIIRFEMKKSEKYKSYMDNIELTNSPFKNIKCVSCSKKYSKFNFYYCSKCKNFECKLCIKKHKKKHTLILIENVNYKCFNHLNANSQGYCIHCKKNICYYFRNIFYQ